jgi:hypothetical protein
MTARGGPSSGSRVETKGRSGEVVCIAREKVANFGELYTCSASNILIVGPSMPSVSQMSESRGKEKHEEILTIIERYLPSRKPTAMDDGAARNYEHSTIRSC